jgi:hypothetical protein
MRFDRKKITLRNSEKLKTYHTQTIPKKNQSPKSRKNLSFYHSSESGKKEKEE